MDLLEDDEEVLVHFSEQVGNLLDLVGGPAHAEHILRILERLCVVEEISVREKATESIKKILASVRIKDFEKSIMEMMQRLMKNQSNTTKYAAIHLIPFVYTYFQSGN